MANKSKSEPNIDSIINEIKKKSAGGDYIYRGERQLHDDVSSGLYREYFNNKNIDIDIDLTDFDLRTAQRVILEVVKKHIGEPPKSFPEDAADVTKLMLNTITDNAIEEAVRRTIEKTEEAVELEILTELQHYGCKTNLIDFTTDYLIAIYFACSGNLQDDGRVILLEKTEEIEKEMIIRPQNPYHRVIAQKSVFLYPPEGFIEVFEDKKVKIPSVLKETFLKYLEKHHGISTETIYNDIHGFIRYQDIHQNAYVQFYIGLTFQYRGYNADTQEKRKEGFKKAIDHYSDAIKEMPDIAVAYANRAECWLHLENWEKTRRDYNTAINMGYDIIGAFHNDYENSNDFTKKTGITLDPDIAKMLGYVI